MLSVNQMNAQIKITEVWKAINDSNHPLKFEKVKHDSHLCLPRSITNGDLKEFGKTNIVQSTFLSDASKIWNLCPCEIKNCSSIWAAKKSIRKICWIPSNLEFARGSINSFWPIIFLNHVHSLIGFRSYFKMLFLSFTCFLVNHYKSSHCLRFSKMKYTLLLLLLLLLHMVFLCEKVCVIGNDTYFRCYLMKKLEIKL